MMKHSVVLSAQVRIEQKKKEREEVRIPFPQDFMVGKLIIFCCCCSNVWCQINVNSNMLTFLLASFELLRKEQQKAFQEKQKLKNRF